MPRTRHRITMAALGNAPQNCFSGMERDEADLAVGIGEIDAEGPLAFFGELHELRLDDHTVDRNIDHRDHRLHPGDPGGRALEPDGVQPPVDTDRGIDRLAEWLVALPGSRDGWLRVVVVAGQAV